MVVIIKSKNTECLDFTLHCVVKSALKIKKAAIASAVGLVNVNIVLAKLTT